MHIAENLLPQKLQKGFWREDSQKEPASTFHTESAGKPAGFEKDFTLDHSPNKNLEIMAEYIKDRLHDITAYAGTHIARTAHEELHNYMTTIENIPSLKEDLQEYNQSLIKEVQQVFKEQLHQVEHIHSKGRDFEM